MHHVPNAATAPCYPMVATSERALVFQREDGEGLLAWEHGGCNDDDDNDDENKAERLREGLETASAVNHTQGLRDGPGLDTAA